MHHFGTHLSTWHSYSLPTTPPLHRKCDMPPTTHPRPTYNPPDTHNNPPLPVKPLGHVLQFEAQQKRHCNVSR
ncbi:hypothetical protein E2C01_096564 [Portunus trituberculatus]|uniref:Uncharacterized protein n=1 Tax=Portunus trituberculatus TaxID=210409 RepID=A0A5B7JSW3_PORTR|nr:hypothetical protein [Portunus trituberculatus]